MKEICICSHGKVLMIYFSMIRERIICTVCALKGGMVREKKCMDLEGMYTVDPDNPWGEGLPFLTLYTFSPFVYHLYNF